MRGLILNSAGMITICCCHSNNDSFDIQECTAAVSYWLRSESDTKNKIVQANGTHSTFYNSFVRINIRWFQCWSSFRAYELQRHLSLLFGTKTMNCSKTIPDIFHNPTPRFLLKNSCQHLWVIKFQNSQLILGHLLCSISIAWLNTVGNRSHIHHRFSEVIFALFFV